MPITGIMLLGLIEWDLAVAYRKRRNGPFSGSLPYLLGCLVPPLLTGWILAAVCSEPKAFDPLPGLIGAVPLIVLFFVFRHFRENRNTRLLAVILGILFPLLLAGLIAGEELRRFQSRGDGARFREAVEKCAEEIDAGREKILSSKLRLLLGNTPGDTPASEFIRKFRNASEESGGTRTK